MLKGTLDDFGLRYVLRFLALARKTGKLSVLGPSGGGKIYFRSGQIYHAESDLPRQGFGRKLVNAGKLTEAQLRDTLEYCAAHARGLGEALVGNGLIARDALEDALREEIEEVALGLFRNESGRFVFEVGEQVESDTLILVPVESLIEDDSEALRRRVPVLNRAFARGSETATEEVEISITSEEWGVIALIDGRRCVGDIADGLGRNELSVLRSLRRLLSVGLVTLGAPAAGAGDAGNAAAIEIEGPSVAPFEAGSPPSPPTGAPARRPPPPPGPVDLRAGTGVPEGG
jgi:hypothetical protein